MNKVYAGLKLLSLVFVILAFHVGGSHVDEITGKFEVRINEIFIFYAVGAFALWNSKKIIGDKAN